MDILKDIMGMQVKYDSWNGIKSLPLYLSANYIFQKAEIDGNQCIVIMPKEELPTLPALKKQIARIQTIEQLPVVVHVNKMSAFRRKSMIESRIPFIVTEKQIYLPFMCTLLQAKADKITKPFEKFMFSTQMLLLLYFYQAERKMYVSEVSKKLPFSAMTMTRATRQLEESGLFDVTKEGVNKVLISKFDRKTLYEHAKGYMSSPVVKKRYIEKDRVTEKMVLAGLSALAERSMLNGGVLVEYAVDATDVAYINKKMLSDELVNPNEQVQIQLWHYNPRLFTTDGIADPISVALSLNDNQDERVEGTVEEMLESLWEDIDGNRI